MIKKIFVCVAMLLVPAVCCGQDVENVNLENVKCVMNSHAGAKAEASAQHLKGTVYFCCDSCSGKFAEKPDEYIAAANFQLVATGQYRQKACPFSGGAVTEGNSVKVGETEIGMCCGNCTAKVEGAADMASKVSMVFAKESFAKGFEAVPQEESNDADLSKVTCPMMAGEAVSADYAAEHLGGKVYFCCDGCLEAFNKEPAKFTVVANKQLVQTGQYEQKACPFSGGAVTEGNSVKIGDHEFGMCCGNCKAKVEGAADDAARDALIFSKDAFKKGFAKATKASTSDDGE